MSFLFSDALISWGPADSGGTAPPRIRQFIERVNTCPGAHLSKANRPMQSPYSQSPALMDFHTLGHYPPVLITPQPGINKGPHAPEPADIQTSES